MKKTIVILSVVIALLVALLVFLFLQPGALQNVHFVLPGVNSYSHAEKYTKGDGEAFGIENIEINWVAGTVELVATDTDRVIFTEYRTGEDVEEMYYWVDGNTLRIQFCESGHCTFAYPSKGLTVQIPKDKLHSVQVDSVSADIEAEGLSCDRFTAETISGRIELSQMVTNRLDGESVSGEILLHGVSASEIDLETVSGDVVLNLPEGRGFTADFETVSGDVYCTKPVVHERGKIIYEDGEMLLDVETVSGDLTLD